MQAIEIGEELSGTLRSFGVEVFAGPEPRPFQTGAVVKGIAGDLVEAWTRHPPGWMMSMGSFSYCANNGWLIVNLKLGRYCSVAANVHVLQGNHPIDAVSTSPWHYSVYYGKNSVPEDYRYKGPQAVFSHSYGPTRVWNDVWIGSHATIRAGITIGDGAVVAGGATVVSDVPPYAIVGGNPARVIRYRFSEDICARLLEARWWNLDPAQLSTMDFSAPEKFCGEVEELVASGRARAFGPPVWRITQNGLRREP